MAKGLENTVTKQEAIQKLKDELLVDVDPVIPVLFDVSRPHAFQMARDGRIPVMRVGSKRMKVVTAALRRQLGID
jgi:hypothetical protein